MPEPFDPKREPGAETPRIPAETDGGESPKSDLFETLKAAGATLIPADVRQSAEQPAEAKPDIEPVEPTPDETTQSAEADREEIPAWLEFVDEGSREVVLGFVTTGLEMHERYGGQMPVGVGRPNLFQNDGTESESIAVFEAMLEGLALQTKDADGKKDLAAALESSREDWVVDSGARFIMYPWLQRAFNMEFYDQDGSLLSNTAIPMPKNSGITVASAVIGRNEAHQETLLVVVEVPRRITSRDVSGAKTEVTKIKRLAYFDTRQL